MVDPVPPLPLALGELPEAIRRFADPSGPVGPRTMAARGLVPIKGADLVTLLLQLSCDSVSTVSDAAQKTLDSMPESVLGPACAEPLHPSMLHALATRFAQRPALAEKLAANHAVSDGTLELLATGGDESLTEWIAANEERLLRAPSVIEALYSNPHTRMSTADRLVDLAVRNDVELPNVPCYRARLETLRAGLEPSAPTPSEADTKARDEAFREVQRTDEHEIEAVKQDPVDGTEAVQERFLPLQERIRMMTPGEKMRLAVVGNAAARAILVRDTNKTVAHSAVASPRMTEPEATAIAHSRQVSEEVLRYIGHKREWLRSYEIKRALVFNPKTPMAISLQFIGHMRESDLRTMTRSRNVPAALKTAATHRMQAKSKG